MASNCNYTPHTRQLFVSLVYRTQLYIFSKRIMKHQNNNYEFAEHTKRGFTPRASVDSSLLPMWSGRWWIQNKSDQQLEPPMSEWNPRNATTDIRIRWNELQAWIFFSICALISENKTEVASFKWKSRADDFWTRSADILYTTDYLPSDNIRSTLHISRE